MRLLLTLTLVCTISAVSSQKLPSYIPPNGLIGYYPLSKALELKDASGNANDGLGHAIHINDVHPFLFKGATDRFGEDDAAMDFSRTDGYVSKENHFTVDVRQQKFSQGFSIGGWTIQPVRMQFSQSLYSKDHTASACAFELRYNYQSLNFEIVAEATSAVKLSSKTDPLNALGWHFTLGTFDGTTLRLYVDGELAAEQVLGANDLTAFLSNVNAGGPFRVGHNITPYVFNATGSIDDVLIYNRALTPAEMRQLFQAGGKVVRRQDIGFELGSIALEENRGIYPEVTSVTKPKAAAAINKVLQMMDFGKIRTPKNPGALQVKNGVEWNYSITWPTKRLLIITTTRETTNTESRGGETLEVRTATYHFDVATGDFISMSSFFTVPGYGSLSTLFKDRFNDPLVNARFDVNPFGHQLIFSIDKAVDDQVSILFSLTETNPTLSAKGNYYLNDGPPPPPEASAEHLWTGLIGTGLHVTLLVQNDSQTAVTGMEVYDNYGTVIPMNGTFANGVLKLNELDDKGNAVGSYEAVMKDRKLSGTWKNKDGSKTLPFSAFVAGEQ